MQIYRTILISLFLSCFSLIARSQLNPPGLGDAHDAGWLAIGVKQDLDTLKKWSSMTYIGLGRKSAPNNYSLFQKQAIFVFNQEFYCQFRPRWQASIALSYRDQNEYEEFAPFDKYTIPYKQEFRLYARLSRDWNWNRFSISGTVRQEIRKFYEPSFNRWHEDSQLRSRARLKCTYKLSKNGSQRIVASGEALINAKHEINQGWSDLQFNESRFCLYYSIAFKKRSLVFDIGYMNDLVWGTDLRSGQYLAIDLVINNPFSKK